MPTYKIIKYLTSKVPYGYKTPTKPTMNTFSKILLSSVVGLSSILGVVGEAEARPTRLIDFTTNSGTKVYFEPVGRNGVEVLVTNDYTKTGFIGNMDCSSGRYQWRANDGYTQNQIRDILTDACEF